MAVTSNQTGSQTATINTEHTLGSQITSAGVYQLVIDTGNMVNGDVIEIRVKTKATPTSSLKLEDIVIYSNIQTSVNKRSIPYAIDTALEFSLKQTAGTGRVFDWNILKL